ncbi:MAG: GGDEF domain-containing protein [Pseudomonadota bacterium]
MTQIRICSSQHVRQHQPVPGYANWTESSPAVRRDFEIIIETANELFGPGTHWLEERETPHNSHARESTFDVAWLRGMAATSIHAQQLTLGFKTARFTPTVESEYVHYLWRAHRHNAQVLLWFALAGWCVLAIADAVRLHAVLVLPDYPRWVWGILIARAGELLLGLVCTSLIVARRSVRPDLLSAAVFLPVALAGGVTSSLYASHGLPQADLLLLLPILAAFFPLGFVFRQSTAMAFAMAILSALPGFFLLPPALQAEHWGFTLLLLLTAGFASVSGYLREMASRDQFLLRGLLRQQAMLDPLTGLHNRRWMDEHFGLVQRRASRDQRTVSFLLIDIDHFKPYNDRFGHIAGDAALVAVGELIAKCQRHPLDVASRLGGDEFGLLLYDCSLQEALAHGEQLRHTVLASGAPNAASGVVPPLSISLGVVQIRSNENAQAFYRRADRLLFESKRSGRNRLTGAGEARS